MTTAEKWAWHTDVYAFRAVHLGLRHRVSPCDPDGKWFNLDLVLRAIREKTEAREQARRHADAVLIDEGSKATADWVKKQGYQTIEAYCKAEGLVKSDGEIDWAEAKKRVAVSFLRMPDEPKARWRGTAADLGVTAREFIPTSERMAADRLALGLEEPPAEESAA